MPMLNLGLVVVHQLKYMSIIYFVMIGGDSMNKEPQSAVMHKDVCNLKPTKLKPLGRHLCKAIEGYVSKIIGDVGNF